MLISKLVFSFLLYFPITCQTRKNDAVITKENVTSEEVHKNLTVLEKWEVLESKIKNLVNKGIKSALPMIMENSGRLNLSKDCLKSGLHLISGIRDLKAWAFAFLDSSGKVWDGLLTGSISSLGQYDQCLDIEVKSTKLRDKGELLFGGQYCIVDIKPPLPPRPKVLSKNAQDIFQNFSQKDTVFSKYVEFTNAMYYYGLRSGICIPSKCSKDDLNQIISLLGNEFYLNASVYRCEVKTENEFTSAAIGVITFYSLIGGLVLVATLIDAFLCNSDVIFKSTAMRVLLAFSLKTNFKKFSATDASKSNSLRCLHGVRFFGMLWIITLHTYIETLEINVHGWTYFLEKFNEFLFQVILNGALSVDTFFFMGGLLVGYITLKLYKDQKHKFNVFKFIIYRLIRILPAYFFIIMFSFLIHMLGSGPVWHSKANKYYEPCYKYWWTNLVFINNFYSSENTCFPTTWYIASDFQLYLFSLIIIIPLLRWPKIGICMGVLTIIASILYSGVETYLKEYPPAIVFYLYDLEKLMAYLHNFNFRPFIHAGPYAMGILAGYFLAIKPKIKITPLAQVIGWSLAFTACFTVVFGTSEWYKKLEAPLVPKLIYASVKRSAWTLGVAWMIICCATGHGGIVNYVLSMNAFVPLGRLTFLAYLVHPIVQMIAHGNARVKFQPSYYAVVYLVLGHTCISYAIAFVVHMLVEVPFANLVRILLSRDGKEEQCMAAKDKDFLEANVNGGKKEDVIAIDFSSNGKSNGINGKVVASTRDL